MGLAKLFTLQFLMFAEMGVGYALCRFKVLKASDRSVLSKLIMNVLLPCSIINSFQMQMNASLLKQFVQIFIISLLIEIGGIIFNLFAWNNIPEDIRATMKYGTICSNAGFLGNAISEGVYGPMGLIIAQIFLVPSRMIAFSFGAGYYSGGKSFKQIIKTIFTNPCLIAVMLGVLKMLTNPPLGPINDVLASLGRCASPIAMVFIGMILGQCGFKHLLTKYNLMYSFVRLLLTPVLTLIPCVLLGADPLVTSIAVVLAAMPAGSTASVFADQYNCNAEFAANCVVFSTLVSLFLLPGWVMLLEAVL